MTKRITALLLAAAVLFCVLMSGCNKAALKYDPDPMPAASPSGERLTAKEYEAALKGSLTEKYTKNLTNAALLMTDNGIEKASQIKKYAAEVNAMLDVMEQGLTEVLSLNPPESFDNSHKVLINSLKLEWEWVQLHRALFSAKTDADVKSLDKEFDLWHSRCDAAAAHNETYMSVYIDILKRLKTMT